MMVKGGGGLPRFLCANVVKESKTIKSQVVEKSTS
jgi:hypothetical protein